MKNAFIAILLFATLFSCNNENVSNNTSSPAAELVTHWREKDPFKNSISPEQIFEIDGNKDNVIEGNDGTIVVVPKGAFVDKSGRVAEGKINISLTEALRMEDMILSNLTTTSDGKLLETDGMIHISASNQNGELSIDKSKPLYIEIPTSNKKEGMMIYKGTRDAQGNMNWINPKPVDTYLQTIDLAELDFLPAGFHAEVEKNIPYKGYSIATPALSDSLYYSLVLFSERQTNLQGDTIDMNEPHNNLNKKIVNGTYTKDSYNFNQTNADTLVFSFSENNTGIDPAIIKTIKTPLFQNTLIATREFEKRIQVIFQTCSNEVLNLYIENTTKNLYEIDELAATKCKSLNKPNQQKEFTSFAALKQTKVKNADVYATRLKEYYSTKLAEVKQELRQIHEAWLKEVNKQNQDAEKLIEDYRKILWKREKYRMERYGFEWSETGWINVDKGVLPKTNPVQDTPVDIRVKNGDQFDQVYCYIVHENIRSIYRLNSTNKVDFFAGFPDNRVAPIPRNCTLTLVTIAYKDQIPYFATNRITHKGQAESLELDPKETTAEDLRSSLRTFDTFGAFNNIRKDQEYMQAIFKENQRRIALKKESVFIEKLRAIAFPCFSLQ